MTMPSKTCTRRRCPSITWKCTRTVSPALNCGMPSRSCLRSRMSMGVLIGKGGRAGRRTMLAKADPLRWPINRENGPDEVVAGDRAPLPAVARLRAVVAHHEVAPLRNLPAVRSLVALARGHVGLVQPLSVDEDGAVPLLDGVARKPDDPLDEGPARTAGFESLRGRVEDDDIAAMRVAEVVDEAVREDAVRVARETTRLRLGAMERRLHRRGRDPVRVHDPGLDREHRPDGDDDGHDPVDHGGPRSRQAGREAVDRPSHESVRSLLCSLRHVAMRPWSPDRRTSGTGQPLNSGGRVYCGNSTPPSSSAENVSTAPLSSRIAPGSRRATASTSTIAGSSPPERTYGPMETESVAMCSTMRSSKPSKRAERRVSSSSPASSSTSSWSSCRPCGVSATMRRLPRLP